MRAELREYKRARILQEASLLFYERGYEATSVDALAARLSVTKPFIYSYFPNKLSLLEAVYEASTERLIETVTGVLSEDGPPPERLRSFIDLYVRENIDHQISSAIFLQEEKRLPPERLRHIRELEGRFDVLLTALIQNGVDAGLFHVPDAKLASLSISGMVRWVHRWYRPDGRMKADEIAATMAVLGLNLVGYRPEADGRAQPSARRRPSRPRRNGGA